MFIRFPQDGAPATEVVLSHILLRFGTRKAAFSILLSRCEQAISTPANPDQIRHRLSTVTPGEHFLPCH